MLNEVKHLVLRSEGFVFEILRRSASQNDIGQVTVISSEP